MRYDADRIGDLFAPHTLARSDDPATSHAAAARVREFGEHHHALILGVLRQFPRGLTAHEIAAHCRLTAHEVGKRMLELARGRVVLVAREVAEDGMAGNEITRRTPSGRSARVWRICDRW